MPRATLSSGIELEYATTGDSSNPPLLVVNGYTSQLISWQRGYIEQLVAQGLFVIQFDNRDVGLSTKLHGQHVSPGAVLTAVLKGEPLPAVPYTLSDMAADGIGLLDHLGIDRAVVGGMSQGGFLSLRVALTAPERVRALILLDTQAGTEDHEVVPAYEGMRDTWLAAGPVDELVGAIAGLIISDPDESAVWIAKWKQRPNDFIQQPFATLMSRDDVTGRLGEITCPAIVVHGTEDVSISMDKAETLAAGLSGCDGVVKVGGAHAANLTNPGPVNDALLAFLADLPD
mgnify:CR=1 FL=1